MHRLVKEFISSVHQHFHLSLSNIIIFKDLKYKLKIQVIKNDLKQDKHTIDPAYLNSSQQFCQSINTFWSKKYFGKTYWSQKNLGRKFLKFRSKTLWVRK